MKRPWKKTHYSSIPLRIQMMIGGIANFLSSFQQRREPWRDAYHVFEIKLGSADPSVRQPRESPRRQAPQLRGADEHTRQRTETLTEPQYGNVYTCSKPCTRIPALHNQPRSPSLI